MIYYLLAIAVITIVFAFIYRARILSVCPICAGVVITWVGGIIALYANASWANPLIIAVLMGASMGALADKYGAKFGLVWKSAMIILGLPAIYLLVQKSLWPGLGLVTLLLLLTFFTGKNKSLDPQNKKDLFKECC